MAITTFDALGRALYREMKFGGLETLGFFDCVSCRDGRVEWRMLRNRCIRMECCNDDCRLKHTHNPLIHKPLSASDNFVVFEYQRIILDSLACDRVDQERRRLIKRICKALIPMLVALVLFLISLLPQ